MGEVLSKHETKQLALPVAESERERERVGEARELSGQSGAPRTHSHGQSWQQAEEDKA